MGNNNMNMTITVNTGAVRVPVLRGIDGKEIGAFVFNPTDVGIITRYNDMVKELETITTPLEAVKEEGEEYAAALNEATARLYAAVDKLFNAEGAAQAFFGEMNPFSPVGGLFYCEQVLKDVGTFVNAQFEAETEKFSARVAQYTNRATRRKAAAKK